MPGHIPFAEAAKHSAWSLGRVALIIGLAAAIAALLDFFGVRAWAVSLTRTRWRVHVPARFLGRVLELAAAVTVLLLIVFTAGQTRSWTLVGLAVIVAVVGSARLVDEWNDSNVTNEKGLRVREASYGSTEISIDVLEKVVALITPEGKLDFVANNDTLGPDPHPNTTKTFRIRYSVGRKRFGPKVFTEGERVVLP